MGQGSSRAGRLTKEDVLFLKANTRYDEDTIQVVICLETLDQTLAISRSGTRVSSQTAPMENSALQPL